VTPYIDSFNPLAPNADERYTCIKFAMEEVDHYRRFARLLRDLGHDWAHQAPDSPSLGAMFHQIQKFCASTRPGLAFPDGLAALGLQKQRSLLEEIVESEGGHGPELATMAGFLVNRSAPDGTRPIDTSTTESIERQLKGYSDMLLGALPGYDRVSGLTVQARQAIAVLERRGERDRDSTIKNLGTALALEIVSNQHLIPGEKAAIVDSGNYGASLDLPEMHYLQEHWGECGAEQQHENNVIMAVDDVLTAKTEALITDGADDFLDSVAALWDVLDATLLQSGYQGTRSAVMATLR
jgi:hypothetical protein